MRTVQLNEVKDLVRKADLDPSLNTRFIKIARESLEAGFLVPSFVKAKMEQACWKVTIEQAKFGWWCRAYDAPESSVNASGENVVGDPPMVAQGYSPDMYDAILMALLGAVREGR